MRRAASGARNSRSSGTSRSKVPARRFVICVNAGGYGASLEVGKVYRSLGAPAHGPADHLRVVDESGEDYVYPKSLFRAITLPAQVQRALGHSAPAA
jgi:hypothetical protein